MFDVGARLKYLRKVHLLSQRELAKRAGMTNSTISAIEKNSVSPSVSSLKKILNVIPISLAEFFDAEEPEVSSFFFPSSKMIDVGTGGVLRKIMSKSNEDYSILLMDETFLPGASTGDMMTHEGEETGIIIEGEVQLTVGQKTELLCSGDGYHFSSETAHRFENISNKPCRLVCCTTPVAF